MPTPTQNNPKISKNMSFRLKNHSERTIFRIKVQIYGCLVWITDFHKKFNALPILTDRQARSKMAILKCRFFQKKKKIQNCVFFKSRLKRF